MDNNIPSLQDNYVIAKPIDTTVTPTVVEQPSETYVEQTEPKPIELVDEVVDDLSPEDLYDEELQLNDSLSRPIEENAGAKELLNEAAPVLSYPMVNPNVTMEKDPRQPDDDSNKSTPLSFVGVGINSLQEFVESPFYKKSGNESEEEQHYHETISNSFNIRHVEELFNKTLEKPGDFVQKINYADKTISPIFPKWNSKPGDVLTGIKARSAMQSALGQGSFFTFPCWHTGIWLTIQAPTAYQLADMRDAIENEIIELGKSTLGGIFGNTQTYVIRHLIELVEKQLYDWSLSIPHGQKYRLRDILKVPDIETLAWAVATVMYPNGYPFEEACVVDIEKCMHVYKEIINIANIFWVNRQRVTPWQQNFMAGGIKTKRTLDDLTKYQSDADWLRTDNLDYGKFTLYLATPTVAENIDAGYTWVGEIESGIRQTIININDDKLNEMMYDRATLSLTRAYSHYVSSIVMANGARIKNRADINIALNEMCAIPDMTEKFNKDINDHITNNTISMIAINRHACPKCEKTAPVEIGEHPYLVPISALRVFFTLRDLRLQYI